MITFTISHQSYFVVGYEPVALWVNIFNDVTANAWYYNAVAFANFHGLFGGYGNGIFAPRDSMTRAMFTMVLYQLEDNPTIRGASRFTDVAPDAWYYNAVQWAAENGVVHGVGNNRFEPNRPISRQEMALMLDNYVRFKDYDMPAHRPLPGFTDYNQIELWAENAARRLSEAGVISGDNGAFKPKDTATRAEVSQLFKNFMRFVLGR
jgi:hypothetical protein